MADINYSVSQRKVPVGRGYQQQLILIEGSDGSKCGFVGCPHDEEYWDIPSEDLDDLKSNLGSVTPVNVSSEPAIGLVKKLVSAPRQEPPAFSIRAKEVLPLLLESIK